MSEIDVQNAKQIRDPMTVLITMEVPDDEVTLTYSGYSSAKVADGSLGNAWPMRLLADLKGDGFPLNGNHVVYNPSTSASETNGKIGVRSNIGQAVSVTVTGNRSIASLSIFVTGAASVTYNGTTTAIVGGQAVIPVGVRSITLTFNPSSATERIEVSEIVAGTTLRITNDSLIKATVSLRSDLSLVNPTLPESELNVEVYNDADISEIVAGLPEDTPITYQAGYEGDMSPIRKFYVSGQVTWADNVLNIHAVDAVHFLDIDLIPLQLNESYGTDWSTVDAFGYAITNWLYNLGVTSTTTEPDSPFKTIRIGSLALDSPTEWMVTTREVTIREFIAFVQNVIRLREVPGKYCWGTRVSDYVLNYVDAGIPKLYLSEDSPRHTLSEDDCADIKRNIDVFPGIINAKTQRAWIQRGTLGVPYVSTVIGSAEWAKGVGISLNLDEETYGCMIGIPSSQVPNPVGFDITPLAPITASGDARMGWPYLSDGSIWRYGGDHPMALIDNETPNGQAAEMEGDQKYGIYSSFIEWSAYYDNGNNWYNWNNMAQTWNGLVSRGVIPSDATTWRGDIYGYKVNYETIDRRVVIHSDNTREAEINIPIKGRAFLTETSNDFVRPVEVFPKMALESLSSRSPITYSFTWKGDPRMQPRDVVEWNRLDGTTETITLETITLTHEKGGTVAEITARKGIV